MSTPFQTSGCTGEPDTHPVHVRSGSLANALTGSGIVRSSGSWRESLMHAVRDSRTLASLLELDPNQDPYRSRWRSIDGDVRDPASFPLFVTRTSSFRGCNRRIGVIRCCDKYGLIRVKQRRKRLCDRSRRRTWKRHRTRSDAEVQRACLVRSDWRLCDSLPLLLSPSLSLQRGAQALGGMERGNRADRI